MELSAMIAVLSEAVGPSGSETDAVHTAVELLDGLVDDVRFDVMGNLIALRHAGIGGTPTVLLDAHMDEIGLIVTGYEKSFLRFQSLGGVDARMLPALEVRLLTDEPLYGIIDTLPPHILSAEEREKPMAADKLFIDVGLSEEEVKARIPLGTPAVFSTRYFAMGQHRLCGKAMDDRACAAILIRALELVRDEELACDVALLLSTQEEVGGRGAVIGAYRVAPEAAVVVDVTHGRSPDAPKAETFELGGGPVIGVGPNMNRRISDKLMALADEAGISCQIEVLPGHSGTNAWPIQISREGVATGLVSLPLRYMHTPVEVLDLRDAEACAQLIAAWLRSYGREDA
ncbi:MAG: M42 family peptidase [Oscillospiraceae bacterium]|nr:M42 family peptidase [Oscillospiraceae bacterium]